MKLYVAVVFFFWSLSVILKKTKHSKILDTQIKQCLKNIRKRIEDSRIARCMKLLQNEKTEDTSSNSEEVLLNDSINHFKRIGEMPQRVIIKYLDLSSLVAFSQVNSCYG